MQQICQITASRLILPGFVSFCERAEIKNEREVIGGTDQVISGP